MAPAKAEKTKLKKKESLKDLKKSSTALKSVETVPNSGTKQDHTDLDHINEVVRPTEPLDAGARFFTWQLLLTVAAFFTRFYRIDHPGEVVFDEVHFGKFASYYLKGSYFFDVHPPMAKILIALVGKLIGYDGSFLFDAIGLKYETAGAPYVAYRGWSALQGSLIIPLLFETLKDCGFSLAGCILGSSLVLLDPGFVAQTRLILLDATLLLAIASSICFYAKFLKQRTYSFKWFICLLLTGVSLGSVISIKYVGLFTVAMIGYAVICDLYKLLDIRAGLSLRQFSVQFAARAWFLIVLPLCMYLFWFWLHFEMLPNSGPGDGHMSTSFQESLNANPDVLEAMQVNYFDTVTIQSKLGNLYLHSHEANYPVHYPDGRVSTGGQQITAYSAEDVNDPNNQWQILPADPNIPHDPSMAMPILGSDNTVRLRHVATDKILITHDVASPSFPTNEEFTAVDLEQALGPKYSDSLFRIHLPQDSNQAVRTKITKFYLEHINTPVALWMSERKLPDWGFGQIELNGNKNRDDKCLWYFGDITSVSDKQSRQVNAADARKPKSFLSKYLELQGTMFSSNNNLKDTHPYQSSPLEWPFLVKGISFWSSTDQSAREQIYLIGNFFGYYFELFAITLYSLLVVVDQVTQLRQYPLLTDYSRTKLYGPLLWFFIGWCLHYFPFFLMGRQLFFHHYLPAYMIAALLSGGTIDLLFGQLDRPGTTRPFKSTSAFLVAALLGLGFFFNKFMPLAYGMTLSVEEVRSLEWNQMLLHYNKF